LTVKLVLFSSYTYPLMHLHTNDTPASFPIFAPFLLYSRQHYNVTIEALRIPHSPIMFINIQVTEIQTSESSIRMLFPKHALPLLLLY